MTVNVLALCGSLRQTSSNAALLRAALQALQATAQQSGARAGHGPTDTGPLSPLH